jgi:hypothetical protein
VKLAVSVMAEFMVMVTVDVVPEKLPAPLPDQDMNLWPALGVAVIVTF